MMTCGIPAKKETKKAASFFLFPTQTTAISHIWPSIDRQNKRMGNSNKRKYNFHLYTHTHFFIFIFSKKQTKSSFNCLFFHTFQLQFWRIPTKHFRCAPCPVIQLSFSNPGGRPFFPMPHMYFPETQKKTRKKEGEMRETEISPTTGGRIEDFLFFWKSSGRRQRRDLLIIYSIVSKYIGSQTTRVGDLKYHVIIILPRIFPSFVKKFARLLIEIASPSGNCIMVLSSKSSRIKIFPNWRILCLPCSHQFPW